MGQQNGEMTNLVVEKVDGDGLNTLPNNHPMVLSCGGIFIPRPRQKDVNDPIYKIINVANTEEPTKVVASGLLTNLLEEILHKESMN